MLRKSFDELKIAQEQVIEKEKLEHELEISRRIQRSILPQEIPHSMGVDYGAMMQPARAVGGDFYDFIRLPDGRMGIVLGDVSDKGVPASLFMAVSYSLVRAESHRYHEPQEVLIQVNQHLLEINAADMFVTLVYGILDEDAGTFDYARAGHPAPMILNAHCNPVEVHSGLGQPLGVLEMPSLDVQHVVIPDGGMVLIYSDGLSEAIDFKDEFFGAERISQALSQCKAASAQEICAFLWTQVNAFSPNLLQHDDFTVVAIRRR
jgi:phosphoserine phosphatase RsbU/P